MANNTKGIGAAKARAQLRKAKEQEQFYLAILPRTHQDYRQRVRRSIEIDLKILCKSMERGIAGYRFAPAIESFKETACDLLQLVMEGRTVFNPQARARAIEEIIATTAKANLGLRRFLEDLAPAC